MSQPHTASLLEKTLFIDNPFKLSDKLDRHRVLTKALTLELLSAVRALTLDKRFELMSHLETLSKRRSLHEQIQTGELRSIAHLFMFAMEGSPEKLEEKHLYNATQRFKAIANFLEHLSQHKALSDSIRTLLIPTH